MFLNKFKIVFDIFIPK